jgi:hypothetical protein
MELTDGFNDNIVETGKTLRGVQRRLFLARTVQSLGIGGQRRAEKEFGWNRLTIRKGMHELRSGISAQAVNVRGRGEANMKRWAGILVVVAMMSGTRDHHLDSRLK